MKVHAANSVTKFHIQSVPIIIVCSSDSGASSSENSKIYDLHFRWTKLCFPLIKEFLNSKSIVIIIDAVTVLVTPSIWCKSPISRLPIRGKC